ncbi:MAG TPA: HAD family phosphatase [Bauldia sp.]|nr:HAD family phosphatase [Bauldia sp.]
MTDIRHIVFDIGKVILEWDPEIPYRRLIPDDAERRRFLTEICSFDWNAEQDRGRTWREAEDLLIAEHPELEPLIRAYFLNHGDMIRGPVPGTAAIIEALADAGWDITALTNYSAETFPRAEATYPILGRFRGITVSGRVRMMKPDLAIYRHHAETFGLEPSATLFFDDSQKNVEGARAAGWNAEVFISPEKMREDLTRYGVKVD